MLFEFYLLFSTPMETDFTHLSDNVLVELYQKELDVAYVGELYKRYALLVYGLCFKYLKQDADAQDALSEIFELILEKLKTHEVKFFKSWLYVLSKHFLIRKIEKKNSYEFTAIENFSEKFMENEESLSLNEKEKKSELLQLAISNLNEEQRTCIELFYYQRKPYIEVASMTGYDLNKVKSAIQNGKRNLKIFMEENSRTHE